MRLLLVLSLFALNTASAQVRDSLEDKLSLDDLVNIDIAKAISNTPPVVKVFLYFDGKPVTKGYIFFMMVNGKIQRETTKNTIRLDTAKFIAKDSISFFIKYNQYNIQLQKVFAWREIYKWYNIRLLS